MGILLEPIFIMANLIFGIWIMIEFHRRYSGAHPLGFATGIFFFPLVPIVSWILAYRIFAVYKNPANREQRRLNRIAIGFGALVFAGVVLLILSVALIAGFVGVSEEGTLHMKFVLSILVLLAILCTGSAIMVGIKCCAGSNKA